MSDNKLSTIDFSLSIKRLAETNYFIQTANVPGVSIAEREQPNRFGGRIFRAGDKITFDELRVTFKVDEDMLNYFEIFDWIVGLSGPQSPLQRKALIESEYGDVSDGTLLIANSSKNFQHQFSFINMFPKSLSEINFDSKATGHVEYATAEAIFRFDHYNYKNLKAQ
jgi:hypothetical protein